MRLTLVAPVMLVFLRNAGRVASARPVAAFGHPQQPYASFFRQRGFQGQQQHGISTVRQAAPWDRATPAVGWNTVASPLRRQTAASVALFSSTTTTATAYNASFFADTHTDFEALGVTSPILLERLQALGLTRPTAVQSHAYTSLRPSSSTSPLVNVTIGAETGSGKTLAYLLPLMDDILERKAQAFTRSSSDGGDENMGDIGYDYARAIILVPNKELVQQVVRMALPLAGGPTALVYGGSTLADRSLLDPSQSAPSSRAGTVPPHEQVRLAIFPGAMEDPLDFPPFRNTRALGGKDAPVDLVVSTPASVGPLGLKPKHIEMFADIPTLVIDEADMLLDGGYIRALENVLLGFRRADRLDSSLGVSKTQHVFVAATLPDYGLRSVDAYLQKKFPETVRLTLTGMHQARHSGLAEQTVWIPETSKQERMKKLVDLLDKPSAEGGLQGEKVMVFLNSVEDVEGASQALLRSGHNALPYHAKMRLAERTATLDRFRRFVKDMSDERASGDDDDDDTVAVLVCSDLAARGIDVPNVDAVVQLQFAGNVVAHLHRMGRCGRAGQKTGRGIVFYDPEKEGALVKVVEEAEAQQERMVLEGSEVLEVDPEGDEATAATGSVKKAFSRKRGFTKKIKKMRREAEQEQ